MRTTLAIAFLFLLLFCIMLLVAFNIEPRIPTPQVIGMAFEWTRNLFGGTVASVAAVGMLITAAQHGSFQRQVAFTLPLLGGLLLIDPHWGLGLSLAAITSVWIFKFGSSLDGPSTPST